MTRKTEIDTARAHALLAAGSWLSVSEIAAIADTSVQTVYRRLECARVPLQHGKIRATDVRRVFGV